MINNNIIYVVSWVLFILLNKKLFSLSLDGGQVFLTIFIQLILYIPFIAYIDIKRRDSSYYRFLGWPHLLIYLALDYINDIVRDLLPKQENLDELLRLYIIKSLREKGYVDFDLFKLSYAPKHYKRINSLFKVYRKELNLIPYYNSVEGLYLYKRDTSFID